MISVVLLAIGAALALPSYREMVEKRQVTHGAEQIMAFANSAQGEAQKQNKLVTVSYARSADDDWCVGATVGATACDCTETVDTAADYCAIDASPWRITNENAGNARLVKSITGDGAYSFDPIRGILVDLDDSLIVAMSSNNEDYQLSLQVSRTGQVVLCSTDSDHSVPGYGVCAPVDES
jgi:type IV fimbrial biogenesis protein FimT